MLSSRAFLSTPLPMVALPWGSRSTSITRLRVATREAARLTQVVVLPTPPFWLVAASILATSLLLVQISDAQHRGIAHAVDARHDQVHTGIDLKLFWQSAQLLAQPGAFHRHQLPSRSQQRLRPASQLLERSQRPGHHGVIAPARPVLLHPAVQHSSGKAQLRLLLDEKAGLLAIAVQQIHLPVPPGQSEGNAR